MEQNKPKSLLLVEDDSAIVKSIEANLPKLGFEYRLRVCRDGEEGLAVALAEPVDLLILDVMLPGLGGFEVCKAIRKENQHLPILMLTARGDSIDRVLGLELGADDYLLKPFEIPELFARIRALMRRSELQGGAAGDAGSEGMIAIGELVLDSHKRTVQRRGELCNLTPMEFDLLWFLAENPGKVFSREQITQIWSYDPDAYASTVNAHITRLRKKIEEKPNEPRYVLTVWGVGYRMTTEEELSDDTTAE